MLLNSVALGTFECELMSREQEENRKMSHLFPDFWQSMWYKALVALFAFPYIFYYIPKDLVQQPLWLLCGSGVIF